MLFRLALFSLPFGLALHAQEMQPRAYLPAPVGLAFYGISYSRNVGGLLFDPSLPIENVHVEADIAALSAGSSFAVLGRSAQVLAVLPYAQADVTGDIFGTAGRRSMSGFADSILRASVNLYGAPAMKLPAFAKYKQGTIVGVSLTASMPTGQYDPNIVLNLGVNRWGFKPEIGISHPLGQWVLEAAAGVWLYTANKQYNGALIRSQDPLGSIQAHVVRRLPRNTWAAFDATFFTGGRSYFNSVPNADYQGSTRLGATFGMNFGRRHSLRVSYFNGTTTRIGSDIGSLGIAYTIVTLKGL